MEGASHTYTNVPLTFDYTAHRWPMPAGMRSEKGGQDPSSRMNSAPCSAVRCWTWQDKLFRKSGGEGIARLNSLAMGLSHLEGKLFT